MRIHSRPWGTLLVHDFSHTTELEESRVEASIRNRRLASWQQNSERASASMPCLLWEHSLFGPILHA